MIDAGIMFMLIYNLDWCNLYQIEPGQKVEGEVVKVVKEDDSVEMETGSENKEKELYEGDLGDG
jgi:hypothetical protein